MWDFFIRKNRFAYLVMLAMIGFGLYAIVEIPKESAPEVQIPVGIVTTPFPGAAATDVENLVTNEIERGLDGSLSDVSQITSSSREGVSIITVEFDTSADVTESIRELRDEVDIIRTNLPDNAEDPTVTEVDFVDQPIYSFAVSGDRSDEEFIAIATEIENQLEDIAGVSRVETRGVREREVHVLVDQAAASSFELSLNDIATGIESANSAVPIGEIVTNDISYNLTFDAEITDPSTIADIPIGQRGGQAIFVRDVAEVIDGVSIRSTFSRLSVEQAPSTASLTFDVYKQRTGDIIGISQEIDELVTTWPETVPDFADLTFFTIQDLGDFIVRDLIQLTTSGLQTAGLVTLLLIVALGWREGIIAGTAIPLSFTIGFIGLWLSGNTINFISLFALILGIGILVDSSIVMVEGINKRMKQNPDIDKTEAAVATIKAFAKPVIAGTLTTVAMFSGLFVVSGVTGEFISSIPFTLVFILLASLLVAIGFIPLLAASFLRRRSNTAIEQAQVRYATKLEEWYTKKLQAFLESTKQKVLFVVLLLGGFFLSFALIPLGIVEVIFFGEGDADNIFVEIELPAGSITDTTDRIVREIEEILYDTDDIAAFSATIGAGSAFLGQSTDGGNIANINITLEEERGRDSNVVRQELRREFATISGAEITITQPDAGPPTGSPVGIDIVGDDLDELTATARDVAALLRDIPGTTNIDDGTDPGASEFVFRLDDIGAAQAGVTPLQVSQTLRAAVVGTEATTINTLTQEIPITVRLNLHDTGMVDIDRLNHTDITTLQNLTIRGQTGEPVILDTLLTADLQESRSVIQHQDRERVVSISSDVESGINPRQINAELTERIEAANIIPPGVRYEIGGETEEADQGFADLFLALIVGIVLMIGVLVLQFNSYRYPLYVLSIVPFSLMGILYGLAIVGSPLSFPSIMGFVALTGIVVNNSILLIDMINSYRQDNPNSPVREMVVAASATRVRPILLTTVTTVLGITPLLFTDPIWVPLATAIMFGLSFSVIITLLLVPMIYDKYPGKLQR